MSSGTLTYAPAEARVNKFLEMARGNDSSRGSDLPRHLRKDPAKQRKSLASRFNFSWIGGMAQQLRNALNRENRIEAHSVRRQSEDARKHRQSELEARKSVHAPSLVTQKPDDQHSLAQESNNQSNDNGLTEYESTKPSQIVESGNIGATDRESGAFAADLAVAHHSPAYEADQFDNASDHGAPDTELDAELDDNYDEEDYIASEQLDDEGDEERVYKGNYDEGDDVEDVADEDLEDAADEDLDAEDFDDEDLDAEDVDADDMDADVMDADDWDDHHAEAAGSSVGFEDDRAAKVDVSDTHSLEEDAYAPIEPSDHEAHEYDAELSSMSVWEGAGFDSYDPAIPVDHEHQTADDDIHEGAQLSLNSEHASWPRAERNSSEPPVTSFPSVESSSVDRVNATPVAEQSDHISPVPVSLEPKHHEPSDNAAGSQENAALIGSRLEPSKRYLGFHFGPALEPETRPVTSKSTNSKEISGDSEPDTLRTPPQAAHDSDDAHKGHIDLTNGNETQKIVETNGHKETEDNQDEDPYAGLWNLFNVGFTVAPSSSPMKIKKESRYQDSTFLSVEPQASITEEFHLLAQAAHRYMASSSIFGGAPAIPKSQPTEEIPAIDSPEEQDPILFNRRVSGIAHDLFSNSPLFGGKVKDLTPEKSASKEVESEMQVDQPLQQAIQNSVSESANETESQPSDHLDKHTQGAGRISGLNVDTAASVNLRILEEGSHDNGGRKVEENIVDQQAQSKELGAVDNDDPSHSDSEVPGPKSTPGNLAETEYKQELADKADNDIPQGSDMAVGFVTQTDAAKESNDPSPQDAEGDSPENVVDEEKEKHSRKQAPKGEVVKRQRRLRNKTSPTEPIANPTSQAKAESPSDSEENEQTETRKRKRSERTKPLTRSALRAQKQKEAEDNVRESDNEADPAPKKRKSKSSQKMATARRRKNA